MRSPRATLIAALLIGTASLRASAQPGEPAEGAPSAAPAPPSPRAQGADLGACLRYAERNHPNIAMARAKLAYNRAQLLEAYSAPFSAFKATGGVALAPTVRGSNVYSPNTDVSLSSSLGVAWRAGIDGVIPLWTFGKIENLWDAAEANVEVGEAGVDVARDAVRMDVRRAYLGLQLARDALALLADAEEQMDEAVVKLEEEVDADEGDPIDLLKLQTYRAELGARRAEAEKFQRVALAGLRFYTGISNLRVKDEPLEKAPHQVTQLERYLAAARVYRPEVHMARAGVAAREAELRLSRSGLFPDLGLALSAGLSAAPEVANQINPFVKDSGNYFTYGAAIVFQWKLDFVPGYARINQAEAKLQEMVAMDRQALGGVAAQVEEAYAEVLDWQQRLAAYEKAAGYAKRWLVSVQQAIDIGTMEEKDLVDPAKTWANHRYNVLSATMEYNLALSKLAQVTGWDAIAPGH